MFYFGQSKHWHSSRNHPTHPPSNGHPNHQHSDPPYRGLRTTYIVSPHSTCANGNPISTKSLLRRSAAPSPDTGAMIGVMLLVLFVLFIGLLLFCIRKGKGGPEKPRRGRSSTADSSTKILDSTETPPIDSEAVPKAVTTPPDNVITHLKDYRPLSNASTLQYTVFGFSPPASSTPNSSPSTQSEAAAAPSRATPCNTPQHDVNPIKRRGIGYTESGRSISPRRTVETISARLEEAEHAQNGVSDR